MPRGEFVRGIGVAGTSLGTIPNCPNVPVSQDEVETTQGFSYNRGTVGTESWDILRHGTDGKTLVVKQIGDHQP
jgi:hypothetical protein